MLGTTSCYHSSALVELDHHGFLQTQPGFVERQGNDLSMTATACMPEGHQEAIDAVHTGPVVGQRHAHRNRRTVGEARGKLHVREVLGNAVVTTFSRQRPGLTERRDTQVAQARMTLL
jgi:hypothetical protein